MKTLKALSMGLFPLAVGLTFVFSVLAKGTDEKIELKDCPEAVQKTIKEQAGDGEILEVEKETRKDGTVVYEAEAKLKSGKVIDIEVAADGKLINVEEDDEDDDDDDEDEDEEDEDDDDV